MEDTKNILIIEDDIDIRETLEQLLELEGYDVFSAPNGKEGVETLSEMPAPSLILLDLMMPVMNGWEFLQAQKQIHDRQTVPVFILSAYTQTDQIPETIQYVEKPLDFGGLLKLIHQVCHKTPSKLEVQ